MENWLRIVTCDDAHVDVNADERTNLQLVVTGRLLHRLYHAGMVSLHYDQREFLLRGYHSELLQVTPTATYPGNLGGVFYPWDFKKMIQQDWAGGAYELERRDGILVLKPLDCQAGYSRSFCRH